MPVKWLQASGHAGSMSAHAVAGFEGLHPDIVTTSEMYHDIGHLGAPRSAYGHFIGAPKRKDSRGRVVNHDVVISYRKSRVDVLHEEEFFVDSAHRWNIKYMPERWGKAMVLDVGGTRVLVVAWHPQPNPLRRARLVLPGYEQSVARVRAVEHRLDTRWQPALTLMGGDLQLGSGRKPFFPNEVARHLALRTAQHSIDWQMWSARWSAHTAVIDPRRWSRGLDHKWLLTSLTERNDVR